MLTGVRAVEAIPNLFVVHGWDLTRGPEAREFILRFSYNSSGRVSLLADTDGDPLDLRAMALRQVPRSSMATLAHAAPTGPNLTTNTG